MAAQKEIAMPVLKSELVGSTRKRLQAALCLLMMNVGELTDKESYEDEQPLPEAAMPHRDAVLSAVKRLDVALAGGGVRDALLGEVTGQRDKLVADTRVLTVSMDYLESALNRVQDAFSLRGLEKLNALPIHKTELVRDCMLFARHMMQKDRELSFLEELLACFPFCMAREKFYAYLKESLTRLLECCTAPVAEDIARMLLYKLFPEDVPGHGALFAEFTERVTAFAQTEAEALTEEELQTLYDEGLELAEDIQFAIESFESLYESYQYLVLLLTFADDAENLTADDAVAKDVFYATVEALLKDEYEAFRDNLMNVLDEKLPQMLDEANAAHAKAAKNLNGFDPALADEELAALVSVRSIVDNLFFSQLRTAAAGTAIAAPELTGAQAADMAADFTAQLKSRLAPLPPKTQKAMRRELFTLVPAMFGPQELEAYLDTAYDAAAGFVAQALIVEKVGRLFERFGYNPPNKNVHEHQHGEDCTCGHDHYHHGEACDCGHTH